LRKFPWLRGSKTRPVGNTDSFFDSVCSRPRIGSCLANSRIARLILLVESMKLIAVKEGKNHLYVHHSNSKQVITTIVKMNFLSSACVKDISMSMKIHHSIWYSSLLTWYTDDSANLTFVELVCRQCSRGDFREKTVD
jgi:hypothetical protein